MIQIQNDTDDSDDTEWIRNNTSAFMKFGVGVLFIKRDIRINSPYCTNARCRWTYERHGFDKHHRFVTHAYKPLAKF